MQRAVPPRLRHLMIAAAIAVFAVAPAWAQSSQQDEIEQLRQQIEELRAAIEEGATDDAEIEEIERRLEALAAEVERLRLGEAAVEATEGSHGLGVAASKVYRVDQGLSIGGYGEMLYETFSSTREDGAPASVTDQLDFLRGVLYFGYKFDDRWVFNSEIEFEHASTSGEGSSSVEFAYVDYLAKPQINFRTGLLLLPMGFLNELHEPPLFLTTERPVTENVIIPSTWRENGLGIFGDVGPFSYRTYVVNGLRAEGFSNGGLRGGRQRGSEALAEDLAWTGRLDYTATPGLLAGVSLYHGDSGQGLLDAAGEVIDATTTIFDVHVDWRYRGLYARGLLAQAEVDDVARLNQALGRTGSASIGEELEGWYLELGYDVLGRRAAGETSLIPYVRLENVDTQAAVPSGFSSSGWQDREILTYGVAFKPLDELVFKIDYQDSSTEADTGVDQFNFAFGYLF